MKKIVFLLLTVLCVISAKAQKYEETLSRVGNEIKCLQTSLDKVNDRIYYLEVTLDEELSEALAHGGKNYLLSKHDLKQLQKEKKLAPDELVRLKSDKALIEESLTRLKKTSLGMIEYRAQADSKSNLPEQMGAREYNRRTRAQIFRMSEPNGQVALFRGLLMNGKMGVGEKATFIFSNRVVKDIPESFTLEPGAKLEVYLPAGEYILQVSCGRYFQESIIHVDPRKTHYFCNDYVYFGAQKDLSDF